MKISLRKILLISLITFIFIIFCFNAKKIYSDISDRVFKTMSAILDIFIKPEPYKMEIITTDDGLEYCISRDSTIFITNIQDVTNVIIPEYIDGIKVVKLGCYEGSLIDKKLDRQDAYLIYNDTTEHLTIQHEFTSEIYKDFIQTHYYVNFTNLETLTYIDYLYCNLSSAEEELIVPHYIGKKNGNVPNVILKKSDREYSLDEFKPKVILIPEYVTEIEKGVFDGLTDVVIKTSYESIPDGWEEGWNGECEVIWGEEIEYLSFYDCVNTTEDGTQYYYNSITGEGVYIFAFPLRTHIKGDIRVVDLEDIIIPEYINGKKVVELGNRYAVNGYGTHYEVGTSNCKNLTVQHEFYITPNLCGKNEADYVSFPCLENLIFIDYLYCNLSSTKEELIVPHYIGIKTENIPNVTLKKSDREYSLEEFKPKVIIIPEYVTEIESGVFDGLEDVVIKTSYESIPEGWEEGWNGNCEVIWGVTIE